MEAHKQQSKKGSTTTQDIVSPQYINSHELFSGRKEVLIRHDTHIYRLRITRQNKLILTK